MMRRSDADMNRDRELYLDTLTLIDRLARETGVEFEQGDARPYVQDDGSAVDRFEDHTVGLVRRLPHFDMQVRCADCSPSGSETCCRSRGP
jgi:hypothetical protein